MKFILYSVIIITIASCGLIPALRYRREPLTMKKEDYQGSQVRTDGFYRNTDATGESNFFLYRSGVILNGMCIDMGFKTADQVAERIKSIGIKHPNDCDDVVFAWGLFKIDGSKITIESWMSGTSMSSEKYRTQIFNGEIINDTTICLDKYISKGRDTFHFTQLPIKPDSTNNFIK